MDVTTCRIENQDIFCKSDPAHKQLGTHPIFSLFLPLSALAHFTTLCHLSAPSFLFFAGKVPKAA
jgi:hypothetical protein